MRFRKTSLYFPFRKKPEINRLWIKFVNRKEWQPTKNSGVCSKHFEEKYLKNGVRTTLRWELNPVPSIYPNLDGVVSKSLLPSMPTRRKSPTRRAFPDQINDFKLQDKIKDFSQIDDSLCPEDGYQLQLHTGKAIFYKTESCRVNDIPIVTEVIVITESLNVKLFWKAIPVPLPEWFHKGSCL